MGRTNENKKFIQTFWLEGLKWKRQIQKRRSIWKENWITKQMEGDKFIEPKALG
jgi:hypothetical protein